MKINALRLALFTLMAGGALSAQAQTVTQGKVNFNGKLIVDTCAVMSGSENQTVTLPTVSTQSLSAANDTAGSTPFQIHVDNCPSSINQVAAHFEMTNMEPGHFTLKNLASGPNAATQVTVQLVEADGSELKVGSTGRAFAVTGTGASRGATMTYGGQYFALGATTPGTVQTYAEFTLAYP
ncbi:MAG: fimbrial protein [Achromobacter sp.]|uniref:fimbrial protein n=1 Tax=Achromobacter sp. TaxID=134375 RepID=UPI003CFECAB2